MTIRTAGKAFVSGLILNGADDLQHRTEITVLYIGLFIYAPGWIPFIYVGSAMLLGLIVRFIASGKPPKFGRLTTNEHGQR